MDLVKLLVQSTGSDAHTLPQLLTGTGSYDSENTTISGLFSDPVSDTGEDKLKVELTASEAFTTSKEASSSISSIDSWLTESGSIVRGCTTPGAGEIIFGGGCIISDVGGEAVTSSDDFMYNSATNVFTIGTKSKVGIGNLNPNEALVVEGNISGSGNLILSNDVLAEGDISGSVIRGEFASADGSDGIDSVFNFDDNAGKNHSIVIKDGIITQWNIA